MNSEPINIQNYEIFFLDFLDGNLSEEKSAELNSFLEKNPALKEELNSLKNYDNNLILKPENIKFKNKKSLKKDIPAKLFEITEIEYLCISEIEKDINEQEKQHFNRLISEKENHDVYNKLKATKLKPDENIYFPRKNILIKNNIPLILRRSASIAVAASIIIFLTLKFNINTTNYQDKNITQVSELKKPQKNNKRIKKADKETKKQKVFSKNKQTFNTHNQTIKQEKNNLLAFEDNESQQQNNINEEFAIPIPDIKVETLISNTENSIKKNYKPYAVNYISEKNTLSNRDRFLKIAEKSVNIWKKITNDDEIELKNKYAEDGKVKEVNFIASNFQFRKTFYNK